MPRSAADRLRDIRRAACDLRDIVSDMDTAAFHALPHADRVAFRAVKNALMELGEATKAIALTIRERHPEVDWKGFAGLRDVVAHQYFDINTERLLPIIKHEIPPLLAVVAFELKRIEDVPK